MTSTPGFADLAGRSIPARWRVESLLSLSAGTGWHPLWGAAREDRRYAAAAGRRRLVARGQGDAADGRRNAGLARAGDLAGYGQPPRHGMPDRPATLAVGPPGLTRALAVVVKEAGLKAIPTDPYDGKPIRLAVIDGQPVIYSVGRDGRDDGGLKDSNRDMQPTGDLIYRLPAVEVRR